MRNEGIVKEWWHSQSMEKYYGLLKQCTRRNAYREFMNMNKAKSQLIKKRGIKVLCTMLCQTKNDGGAVGKNLPANARHTGLIPGSGRSPGGGNSNPFSILAWKIPWREETSGLQPIRLQRVGHDWVTEHACTPTVTHPHTHTHTSTAEMTAECTQHNPHKG